MKKLFIILAVHMVAATLASAQTNTLPGNSKPASFNPTSKQENSLATSPYKSIEVNGWVETKFAKQFAEARDVAWANTSNGFLARFTSNSIQSWAFLNKRGNCLSTMHYYTEKELPANIRKQVKRSYYDFTITSVKEINCNNLTAYLVTIEDKTTWKVIRIVDGEMDIFEEHQKIE